MPHPRPPLRLSTARDLIAYHDARDRLYRATAQLLGAHPTERDLKMIRTFLGSGGAAGAALQQALADGRAANAGEEYEHLLGGHTPSLSLQCHEPGAEARTAACTKTQLALPGLTGELNALASLADRTARSLGDGDLAQASALSDLQVRFLKEHAAACLGGLSTALISSGAIFYTTVGSTLAEQIREDLALLSAHPH